MTQIVKRRLLLIGSYPLEQVGEQYFAPQNYLNHWHHLAELCDGIDFHAHIRKVESPQYKTCVDTSKIKVFPLSFLSKPHKQRTWRDFIADQKLLTRHARDTVGWVESFPSAGGMLSPLYFVANNTRRIIYLKVDWREQLLHRAREMGGVRLKDKLRILYFDWSQKTAVRRADATLVRGQALYEKYRGLGKHIELARPIASFSSEYAFERKDSCNSNQIRILYVGDLCKRKRPLDIINAASLATQKLSGRTIHITFIGKEHEIDWERITIEEIMSEARKRGLERYVECPGHVNDPVSLSSYYRQADIFMLLSSAEGFPRVVNEALLHSLPVITTPVGGMPLELTDKVHAFFVPVGNPEAAADALIQIIQDSNLRQRLISMGYQWAKEQMEETSWQQHARLLGLL